MSFIEELRRRSRHIVIPALGVCMVGYFAYHTLSGQRGLFAWHALRQQVAAARDQHDAIRMERQTLEHRVSLLGPDRVDPDMLDEWARRVLNYGLPSETTVLIDSRHDRPQQQAD